MRSISRNHVQRGRLATFLIIFLSILYFLFSPSSVFERADHHIHGLPSHALIRRAPHSNTESAAVSFSQHSQTTYHNISTASSLARKNEEDDRLIYRLVCKGDRYIDMITRSAPTAKIWKQQDLDNGLSVEEEDFDPSENILPALQDLEIPLDQQDVRYLEINQNERSWG
ncbi:MAG: hypothetical protein Q9173_005665 [Seirophora scorigena]